MVTKKLSVPNMIDISAKAVIRREAIAEGTIHLRKSTLKLMLANRIEKGDPLQIGSIGSIQAIKETPRSLLMCHPIPVESSKVEFEQGKDWVKVRVTVIAFAKTGVEMEALNGVATALLNIWDVVKKYEKTAKGLYPTTLIDGIRVVTKLKGGH